MMRRRQLTTNVHDDDCNDECGWVRYPFAVSVTYRLLLLLLLVVLCCSVLDAGGFFFPLEHPKFEALTDGVVAMCLNADSA